MKMSRREFLYAVSSATAGIAGWVLIPACDKPDSSNGRAYNGFGPKLVSDVTIRRTDEGGELLRPDEQGLQQVVCHVNRYGLRVITGLDGKQTVQNLAGMLCASLNPAMLAQTEASVALFLATLAQAGLLAEPFFVNLHAVEVTV